MASNLIQIGGIYLTDDGTNMGSPCRTTIDGLPNLKSTWRGNAVINADSTPSFNLSNKQHRFEDITIKFEGAMLTNVFDALNALFEDAFETESLFALNITGETGNFNLAATQNPTQRMQFGKFESGYILETILYLKVF